MDRHQQKTRAGSQVIFHRFLYEIKCGKKTKIMASSPITSWQIDGETVSDFIFGGSKIIADGYCSHEIKRYLFLGRKAIPAFPGEEN